MNDLDRQPAESVERPSKREFLIATAAAVAAAGLSTVTGSSAVAATPKKGGFARFALSSGSQNDTFNPATWSNQFAQTAFSGSMCNGLIEISPDGKPIPDIAESFEPADGGRKWIFKLRPGLTFHNGRSLTPEDVIASFQHHMGPKSASAARTLLVDIVDITVDDPRSVAFSLKNSNFDFPYIVADSRLPIMPAAEGGGLDWKLGVGTGSFILENFNPGVSVKMKRNPNYHKPNKPYLDEFEMISIFDPTARLNAIMTGEVDFVNDVDMQNIGLVSRNRRLSIVRAAGPRHVSFDMDTTKAPFDNVNVRLALKHAIDREDIIRKVFLKEAKAGNDSPISSSLAFYADPKPKHEYDVNKAKEYLQKAGLTSLSVDLSVANIAFPGSVNAGVLFKEHAAKAGININIVQEADDGYWENVWRKKPFNSVNWYGRATCDALFSVTYAKGASSNNTHWSNDRFNELLVKARSEATESQRAGMYAEMQQLVHDDGGAIVVAFLDWIYVASKRLAYERVGGILPCDNLRMTERWWLA